MGVQGLSDWDTGDLAYRGRRGVGAVAVFGRAAAPLLGSLIGVVVDKINRVAASIPMSASGLAVLRLASVVMVTLYAAADR